MDKQQEIKEFQAFIIGEAKSKGKDPNKYVKELGEDGLKEAYKRYQAKKQKAKEKEVQKALHGAKLNYFKRLKNQCADDEEIVYYKKGGFVKCGCKKKEDGGEVVKAKDGWKNKFKKDQASKDSIRINSKEGDDELEATRPGTYKPNPKHNPKDPNSRSLIWVPDRTKEPYSKENKTASIRKNKPTTPVSSKNCGGAVKKFKKHRQGGSLNGIPFYQNGTPKGGVNPMYTSRKIGNILIEHTNDDLDKINEPNWERKYGAYSKWHIIDPNKGYNFEIYSGRLRDGGSQTLRSQGDSIPQELKNLDGLRGGLINYRGFKHLSPNDSTIIANRRNLVNSILSNYGLNFKE